MPVAFPPEFRVVRVGPGGSSGPGLGAMDELEVHRVGDQPLPAPGEAPYLHDGDKVNLPGFHAGSVV